MLCVKSHFPSCLEAQVLEGCSEVPQNLLFSRPDKPSSQSAFIEVLQPTEHSPGSPLESLQQPYIFLVLRTQAWMQYPPPKKKQILKWSASEKRTGYFSCKTFLAELTFWELFINRFGFSQMCWLAEIIGCTVYANTFQAVELLTKDCLCLFLPVPVVCNSLFVLGEWLPKSWSFGAALSLADFQVPPGPDPKPSEFTRKKSHWYRVATDQLRMAVQPLLLWVLTKNAAAASRNHKSWLKMDSLIVSLFFFLCGVFADNGEMVHVFLLGVQAHTNRQSLQQQDRGILTHKATAEPKAQRQLKLLNYWDLMQLCISTENDWKPLLKVPLSGEAWMRYY